MGAVVFFLQQRRLSLNTLDPRASSNISLLDDNADDLRLMVAGVCLITVIMWVGIFSFYVKRLVVWFSVWLEESIWQFF